ncbi:MAG: HNH endonuclease [Nitrospirota bacterium]
MSFCWFTSYIGYPNFFKKSGHPYELAQSFLKLAKAAQAEKSYAEAKDLFPDLDHAQVETKKAAFQEFGLLYVVPRSNIITLSPVGKQIYEACISSDLKEKNRRFILFALSRALAHYQFNNPLPVGGNRGIERAQSTDVLPYLACYYLLLNLNGLITVSEIRGAIFGLQQMSDIPKLLSSIVAKRKSKTEFKDLPGLPAVKGTADNLKIYFMSHLSLDGEILKNTTANYYGSEEQAFELTELGHEIIGSILDELWPRWRSRSASIPRAKKYSDIHDYFSNGVGQLCTKDVIKADLQKEQVAAQKISQGILDQYDVENLKELPIRNFKEGQHRLVQHSRLEKIRNTALVREAKRLYKKSRGRLFCEICTFDFEHKYGLRGKDYIEAHHKTPISELKDMVTLTVSDLAMVCSNCHRMLHRPPWITIEDLRATLTKK